MLASMTAAPRLATYADLLATPEDVKAEILAGELVVQPSALPEHSYAQAGVVEALRGPFDRGRGGPGGWWILFEVVVKFTDHDVVRPDLVGWRRERLPSPWGKRPIEVVPDWICEILSPKKGVHRDRVVKSQLYARHGVPFYWLLDPLACVLEAFTLERGRWTVAGTYDRSSVVRVPPFEPLELVVADLFVPEPPSESEG
jgi:Uma2 family endonuclease